jgi:NitT/TauT family transport system ATP-binding protein
MEQFLQLNDVHFAYPERGVVVRDVSLQMVQGEIHCLIGRSGCGKTTLLKLAAGLLKPQQGHVWLQGQSVQSPQPEMGFVFQSPTLLAWLSVLDNVLLPLRLDRAVNDADHHHAELLLATMGLGDLLNARPSELSGGQQSRVAIARALIAQPLVLFMDEPFAALDAITREELQHDFLTLCQAQGITVLFVTHDIGEAVFLADQVSLMKAGAIQPSMRIDLQRPREVTLRYTAPFTALCAQLRRAMDGSQ